MYPHPAARVRVCDVVPAMIAAFGGALLGGDGVYRRAGRRLLAPDAHAPVRRSLAPAAVPL